MRDYVFVLAQILLFLIYVLPIRWVGIQFSPVLNWIGLLMVVTGIVFILIALVQLNIHLSPFPAPVNKASLITNGIFKISRHPIYAGIIFSSLGYGLFSYSIFKILTAMVIILLLYFKSKYEEGLLIKRFPEYRAYKRTTRRFI